jgi:hypothetical protein
MVDYEIVWSFLIVSCKTMNIRMLFNFNKLLYRSCTKLLASVLVGMIIGLVIPATIAPAPVQAQSLFDRLREMISPSTDRGSASGRSRGGSIRGICTVMNRASSVETNFVALIPTGNVGTTVEAYPTFWFYVPRYGALSTGNGSQKASQKSDLIPAKLGEFMLLDDQGRPMLKEPIAVVLAEQAGFVKFTLPADPSFWKPGKSLMVGKRYNWFFSIVCDGSHASANPSVRGWVERIEKPKTLDEQLKKATPTDQFGIYLQAGSWYESVTSLAQHRQNNRKSWLAVLDQFGLTKTVDEPIFELTTVKPAVQPTVPPIKPTVPLVKPTVQPIKPSVQP